MLILLGFIYILCTQMELFALFIVLHFLIKLWTNYWGLYCHQGTGLLPSPTHLNHPQPVSARTRSHPGICKVPCLGLPGGASCSQDPQSYKIEVYMSKQPSHHESPQSKRITQYFHQCRGLRKVTLEILGFEPGTVWLASRCSTPELHPPIYLDCLDP